jgi:ribosomal protein L37AE/L43A
MIPIPKGRRADMEETALAPANSNEGSMAALDLDVQRVVTQTIAIQKVMKAVMRPGEHYGVVPGTEKRDKDGRDISKPSLFQPGADKLCLLFRIRPEYEVDAVEREDFIALKVRCRLFHIPSGELWGEGMGSANSREARNANQATARICPSCRKPAISRGAAKFGGGWYCNKSKDGCGAKFADNAPDIVDQVGQVDQRKIWDLHNTMLKMACKRARVAAVLTATAASDIFTQDLEDLVGHTEAEAEAPATQPARPAAAPPSNGNVAPGAASNGGKKATPIQVRDLNLALNDALIGFEMAKDLKGREKEDTIYSARIRWVNSLLPKGREVRNMAELSGPEIDDLIKTAKGSDEPGSHG